MEKQVRAAVKPKPVCRMWLVTLAVPGPLIAGSGHPPGWDARSPGAHTEPGHE